MTHSDPQLLQRLNQAKRLGWLFRWHRRIGLLAALPVLLWALSGLGHPIMTRLFPSAASMQAPVARAPLSGVSLATIAERHPLTPLQEARLLAIDGAAVWQVREAGQIRRRYFSADTQAELPDADRQYAIQLARHFTGDRQSAVQGAELLTAFDEDYPSVNRLLPVWRIEFDRPDHLRAYIETGPARLSALVDDRKALCQNLFRTIHNWEWAKPLSTARQLTMSVLLLAAAGSVILGLWLYARQPSRPVKQAGRRWHRRLGLLAGLSTLAFTLSGLFHIWREGQLTMPRLPHTAIAAEALHLTPAQLAFGASLLSYKSQPVWRLAAGKPPTADEHAHHGGHAAPKPASAHYLDAGNGQPVADVEAALATDLARQYLGDTNAPVKDLVSLHQFGGDYGFINKRLPVVKVTFATKDQTSIFIEPATGALAARVEPIDRLEGYSFGWLHKAHWLDGLGKDGRDGILAIFALLNAVLIGLGVWQWQRNAIRKQNVNGA